MRESKDPTDQRGLREVTEERTGEIEERTEETEVKEVRDQTRVSDVTSVRNSVTLPETALKLKVPTEEDPREVTAETEVGTEATEVRENASNVSSQDTWLRTVM
jgi:hypothetical protein